MWQDPIVEEIHKAREALAAQFQYDVQALGKFFQAQQATEHRMVVTHAPRRVPEAVHGPTPIPDQAEPARAGDSKQRPLRSRCLPRLTRSVAMTSDVKS